MKFLADMPIYPKTVEKLCEKSYASRSERVRDAIRNYISCYELDSGNHLEVILLRGEGEDVNALTGRIMSLRGVKQVKLNITSVKKLYLT